MPKKPCAGRYGNCSSLVKIGEKYCPDCQPREKKREQAKTKEYDRKRGTPTQRGYGAYWKKVRAHKLKKDPLCEKCLGLTMLNVVPAVLVHHIDGNSRNNINANLMSLCNPCHEKIHKKDRWGKSVR
jgi:5-methylcytosine-specific restriction protein A